MAPRVDNAEVVRALREMALFLELDAVPFKPQAYQKAAYAVAAMDRPLAEIFAEGGEQALAKVAGIGKGIARRIADMLASGAMADLEAQRRVLPVDMIGLTAIAGIGPKKVRALFEGIGVQSIDDLERAAQAGLVRGVPYFGVRSERRILEAVAFAKETAGRRPLGQVLEVAERIAGTLTTIVGETAVVGSIRRRCETVRNVDLVVASRDLQRVARAVAALPDVRSVLAVDDDEILARLSNGLDARTRVVAPDLFGTALLRFTGSTAHVEALLRNREQTLPAGSSEEDVYAALGMQWIPPELREHTGEIELAQRGDLPPLVQASDIRGDLQMHTTWSDGATTIEGMAKAAKALGREYIVITDHSHGLPVVRGLDERRVREQIAAIRAVDRSIDGIRVLAGVEVNLRADGTLDLPDDVLAELDLVGAAIHSHFDQPRAEMTRRILRGVANPHVDVLFHPTARNLGRRRGGDFDLDAVIEACRRSGTVLEIDAQPQRLDLPDVMVRRVIEGGVRISIDSDAHTVDELAFVDAFGVAAARRGWARAENVLNALPVDALLATLA